MHRYHKRFLSLALVSGAMTLLTLLAPTTTAQAQDGASATSQSHIKSLLSEINRQQIEIEVLREELAESQFIASQSGRELEELKKFIEDFNELGEAFERYQGIKELAEREQQMKIAAATRERYEQIKAERRKRYDAARAVRNKQRAEKKRIDRYKKSGFTPLGLDVYTSRISYFYTTKDATRSRIDYASGFGNYLRLYPNTQVDYSEMTISGSVLNASKEVRNIGVAITFFDENGNQVGHEIIQVNNARPDVPYPFTSDVSMALNRAFNSTSTYVLYADSIEEEE